MISNLFSAIGIVLMSGVFAIGGVNVDRVENVIPTTYQNGKLDVSKVDDTAVILYFDYTVDLTTIDFTDLGTRQHYNLDDMSESYGTAFNFSNGYTHSLSFYSFADNLNYGCGFSWKFNEYLYDQSFSDVYNVQVGFPNTIEFRFYDFTGAVDNMSGYYPYNSSNPERWYRGLNSFPLVLNTWYTYTEDVPFFQAGSDGATSLLRYLFEFPYDSDGNALYNGKIDIRFVYRILGNTNYVSGYTNGMNDGYSKGYTDALSTLSGNTTFSALFSSIADTPLRFLYGLFNFDLFGISMIVIIMSLVSGIIVFGIVKKFIK